MFGLNLKRLVTSTRLGKLAIAGAAAVALGAPAVTQASDHRDDHRDDRIEHRDVRVEHRDHVDPRVSVQLNVGRFQPERRVYVEPVYRTVTERRWVEPVYQTVCDQVLVPAVYEDRQVQYYDHGRLCTRIDRILVTPQHYESHDRQVCVTEGHWESFDRQDVVAAGHWDFR
jgi:hypothetical protein